MSTRGKNVGWCSMVCNYGESPRQASCEIGVLIHLTLTESASADYHTVPPTFWYLGVCIIINYIWIWI